MIEYNTRTGFKKALPGLWLIFIVQPWQAPRKGRHKKMKGNAGKRRGQTRHVTDGSSPFLPIFVRNVVPGSA